MRDKIVRNISKKPICGIYQIINKINNKIYVGQSIDIERRWNQHRYGKGSIILRNAIKKYGIENFEFEILEIVEFIDKNKTIELLTELEQKWLNNKKPYLKENGYNQNKTSKPNIPVKRPEGYGDLISKIKIDNNHCGKPIKQYDLNGNLLREWKSAAQAERVLGFKAENISACCLNKSNSSNGFIWLFKQDKLTEERINEANSSKRLSKVRQYNLKGELIGTFINILDASDKTNISQHIIRAACNGSRKTGASFIWKFKNEPLILLDHLQLKDLPINQLSLNNEVIIQWDNINHISSELNISKHSFKSIYKACREGKIYKGYKWEWAI